MIKCSSIHAHKNSNPPTIKDFIEALVTKILDV